MNKPHNTFVVDFVARGNSADEWRLVLVEQGPWQGSSDVQLHRLQNRLYECIDAALDGQVAAKFPSSLGKRLIIQVDGYGLPDNEASAFFARFTEGVIETDDYKAAMSNNRFVATIEFELNLKPTPTTPTV
jgi:hypothetical protein